MGETGGDLVQKAHVKLLVLLELVILSVGAEVGEEALSTRLSERSLPTGLDDLEGLLLSQ